MAAVCAAGVARAAEKADDFHIRREPLAKALVDLAVQANLSVDTSRLGSCAPAEVSLDGRYTASQALAKLLAGTGCGYRALDPGAFVIVGPASAPVVAAPRRPSAPFALGAVLVTATQRPTPEAKLAYSVSAYGPAALAVGNVRDLTDLAQVTPAMTLTNLGPGRDKIFLRGLSDGPLTGRTQSMVGLYLDGTRLTYNAPDPDLRLVDMAQVEVLRGPQGALYGAGSLGGIIEMTTVQPDPSRLSGWADATLAATQGGAASRSVDAVVNLPVIPGVAAVRGVFYEEHLGGYMFDAALGLRDANATVRRGGRLALALDLNERWSVTAGLVGQSIDNADAQYSQTGQPAYVRQNLVREPHDNDFNAVRLGVHGDLSFGDLRWSWSYVRHTLDTRYDATDAPPVPIPPGPAAFDESDGVDSLISEAVLTSKGAGPVQWLAGASYARTGETSRSSLLWLGAQPFTAYSTVRRDRVDEATIYGDVTFVTPTHVNFTLGGRLFWSPTTVSSAALAPAGAPAAFSGSASTAGFAPKFLASYSPDDHWLFYAQAAEGYRSNGINAGGPPGQVFSGPGGPEPKRIYRGDELWNLEAGLKLTLLDARLRLRLAGYEFYWKNIQSNLLLPSGLPYTANIGDGRNSGLEFEGAWQVGALDLATEFLINSPELSRTNPGFTSLADFSLSTVPDVSAGVSAHYTAPLGADRSLEFDGRWTYVGRSRLALNGGSTQIMGDYSQSRIAATLVTAPWSLTLAVDNLGGGRGNTFGFGNPFTLRLAPQVTPLRPRTLSLTFKVAY